MTKKLPIVIEAVYNTLLTNIPNIWNSLPKTVTGSTSFSTLQKDDGIFNEKSLKPASRTA